MFVTVHLLIGLNCESILQLETRFFFIIFIRLRFYDFLALVSVVIYGTHNIERFRTNANNEKAKIRMTCITERVVRNLSAVMFSVTEYKNYPEKHIS